MKASDIMTKEVVTINGSATVADAVKLLKDKGLRALIVEPRYSGDPYGMVSETDVIYKVAAHGHDPKAMRVYEIMTKPCIVITPDLGVEYVARLFSQSRIRRAPVIQGELLGVVSASDILRKSNFVEKPKQLFIEDRIDVAREEARAVCKAKGETSPDCAAAWDVVEELQMAASDQRSKQKKTDGKSSFEVYCEDNPNAKECRIHDD
ncbi:MAG: CBS domain-containing protein [Phormidesmis sp.]